MSTDKKSSTETPFGYTFEDSDLDSSSISYPPPNERPLLHDDESGFLESFFNNPNDVDPGALTSMPTEFPNEGNNMFSNGSNFDWINPASADFGNTANSGNATQTDWRESDLGQQASAGESIRSMPASSDVYAAAGILHSNNTGRHGTGSFSTFADLTSSNGGDISRLNGYQYPPLNSGNGPNYNFSSSASVNSPYNGLGTRFGVSDHNNPYAPSISGRAADGTTRSGQLNFGTDDSFRNSIFSATSADQPDKDLAEALTHNLSSGHFGAYRRSQPAPPAVMRKRSRASMDSAFNDDDDESGGEESMDTKRRRVGRVKDEDQDTYGNGSLGRARKGRKKQSSIGSSLIATDPPSGEKKPRALGVKPVRENLSEEQKRNNHIQSEQKRRNLIKQGFDDLNRMVPELRSGSLSKSNMLQESARFIRQLKQGNDELAALVHALDKG